jgi:hypothetical protein
MFTVIPAVPDINIRGYDRIECRNEWKEEKILALLISPMQLPVPSWPRHLHGPDGSPRAVRAWSGPNQPASAGRHGRNRRTGYGSLLDRDFSLDHLPAGCAFGLVADKNDIVGRDRSGPVKVVDNAAAGAHAAAGDDDGRAGDGEQPVMVLVFTDRIEALEIEGVVAVLP